MNDRLRRLLAAESDRMVAAPIVETFLEFRDLFDRDHARVSVELTGGKWSTFARYYGSSGMDPLWREHPSREVARDWARRWLQGLK